MAIAFVTMVYNDDFFLRIWLNYYTRFIPRSQLYVLIHGPQPSAEKLAEGCNIIYVDRDPENPHLDKDRFSFISSFCAELTTRYDRVIYNDVDEILVLDPKAGDDLATYIAGLASEDEVVTPLGLEVIHRTDIEGDYDYSRGMFNQRCFIRVSAMYTKPCITSAPVIWGPDGHGSSYPKIKLDDNLYLFHLKWFDHQFHLARHNDRLNMRFKDSTGKEVIIGYGTWRRSEMEYLLISNKFLRMSIDRDQKSFDFSTQRARIVSSFVGNRANMYKISWMADTHLRLLPERFIGMF